MQANTEDAEATSLAQPVNGSSPSPSQDTVVLRNFAKADIVKVEKLDWRDKNVTQVHMWFLAFSHLMLA